MADGSPYAGSQIRRTVFWQCEPTRADVRTARTGRGLPLSILDAIRNQVASVDTPFMRFAQEVQHFIADHVGGDDALRVGPADTQEARKQSDKTLSQIDWSQRDIVIWVPATLSHEVPKGWEKAVSQEWGNSKTKPVLLDYPASVNFRSSVPTGIEALKLTLDGIKKHGGNHRVLLAGHSQGAWVIGDAMLDPVVAAKVDKAVLYGRPTQARSDNPRLHESNKVEVVNNADDPFTQKTTGIDQAAQGLKELDRDNKPGAVLGALTIGAAVLANPFLAAYLIGRKISHNSWRGNADPHHYDRDFAAGAKRLRQA